ncbi:hypothetical protein ACHAXR_010139 [Thalassiosira sp. AJA248-18]
MNRISVAAPAGKATIGNLRSPQWCLLTTRCCFKQRAKNNLRPPQTLQIHSLASNSRRAYLSSTNPSAQYREGQLWGSVRNPTFTCTYLSSLVNPTSRWISQSRPLHEAAEKQLASKTDAVSTLANHQPPLPVRIALVSTTTALATPAFPALGFLYAVLRVTTPDANLRQVMAGRWGALLSFTTWTLLPNLYHGAVASMILPCAIGNAVVAGGVYGLVDLACGGPSSSSESLNMALRTPWITGSGIGATVGYIAPHYTYGPIMENLYALDGMSQSLVNVMSFPYATEVSVATGAVAGMLLHPLLYFPMNGISGLHWGYFSGASLAAVSSALFYVYYGREDVGLPVPDGSFIEPPKMAFVDSVMRYNNISGEVETYSLLEHKFIGSSDKCEEGKKIAEASRSYAESGKAVFDDRLLAFVYNYWDGKTDTRNPDHVLTIKSKHDLQQQQNSMVLADASVALILQNEKHDSTEQRDMVKVLATIDELNSKARKQPSPTFKYLEDVSVAIELLMIMKQFREDHATIDVQTLEQFIFSRCPGLTLYTSDEQYDGESVESQLHIANWKEPKISHAIERWNHIHEKETYRTWRNRAIFVASGVFLSIAGAMLQSR